jgi:ATP-dependent Clp protease ATP-binding subunit ClpA
MSIASTLEASVDLGHNYIGCEHLLLGLRHTPDSEAARVLQSFGIDAASGRRAVTTAIPATPMPGRPPSRLTRASSTRSFAASMLSSVASGLCGRDGRPLRWPEENSRYVMPKLLIFSG